jgi:hypothetical protein
MRSSILFALLAVPAIAAVACEGRHTLTGPDAQRAYARVAADVQQVVPAGPIVFVDGKRMPPGTSLDQMDPKQITRIEVVKGAAAVGRYGEEGRTGVINIFTRAGQADSSRR